MDGRFVSYLRVSTARQRGRSGLGLEAQRAAVSDFLAGRVLLREVVEIESGAIDKRPQLACAFETCQLTGGTLLVARLDRLSRDAAFLLALQKAGVKFVLRRQPTRHPVHRRDFGRGCPARERAESASAPRPPWLPRRHAGRSSEATGVGRSPSTADAAAARRAEG